MAKTAGTATCETAEPSAWLKDREAIAKEVRLALVSDFNHLRAPNKEVARHAGCSHRTVEAWVDRDAPTLPGLEHFLRLVPKSASLQKMLQRLMTFDPDTDPEYQRAVTEFQRAAVELIRRAKP